MGKTAPRAAPAKAPKKKARRPKKPSLHTTELVLKAVCATKDRKGISYYALRKALGAQGYDVERNTVHIKQAIKYLQAKDAIVQTKGNGACGSFKAGKAAKAALEEASKSAMRVNAAAKRAKAATIKNANEPADTSDSESEEEDGQDGSWT